MFQKMMVNNMKIIFRVGIAIATIGNQSEFFSYSLNPRKLKAPGKGGAFFILFWE